MPKLENWSVVSYPTNPFQAPKLWPRCLAGRIYGDPRFEDGMNVSTSTLQALDVKARTAKTRNTEYQLGEPSDDYKQYCKDNNIEL